MSTPKRGTKKVRVIPLSQVIGESGLDDDVIHILKIDTQGTDIDVFSSLGRYIPNVLFVQLEALFSDENDQGSTGIKPSSSKNS